MKSIGRINTETDKGPKIKRMTVKEFRELGGVQEINRRFLHPMGMALEVIVSDDGESVRFGEVWDYRDDPEGIRFHEDEIDDDFVKKSQLFGKMLDEKFEARDKALGWFIQPAVLKKKKSNNLSFLGPIGIILAAAKASAKVVAAQKEFHQTVEEINKNKKTTNQDGSPIKINHEISQETKDAVLKAARSLRDSGFRVSASDLLSTAKRISRNEYGPEVLSCRCADISLADGVSLESTNVIEILDWVRVVKKGHAFEGEVGKVISLTEYFKRSENPLNYGAIHSVIEVEFYHEKIRRSVKFSDRKDLEKVENP